MRSLFLALTGFLTAADLAAQSLRPVDLVRCASGSGEPCGVVQAELSLDQATRIARSGIGFMQGWQATFGRDSGLAATVSRATSLGAPRILILLDVSSGMQGNPSDIARIAVRQFIAAVDSASLGAARIAVAGFGSIAVAPRIGQATFSSPDSALLALDALPAPDREHRALYSAVSLGAFRAADAGRGSGAGNRALLLVVTNGGNELGPDDDAGLLADQAGLSEAARTADQNSVALAVVGIGDVGRTEHSTLAGSRGLAMASAEDVGQLGATLDRLVGLLQPRWSLTVRLPAAGRAALGRLPARLQLGIRVPGDFMTVGTSLWKPPLVALPAFGRGSALTAADGVRAARGTSATGFVAVLLALLLVEIWIVVPRLLWAPARIAGAAPVAPLPSLTRSRMGIGVNPGRAPPIRSDLTEVPPRKPADITASRARRK